MQLTVSCSSEQADECVVLAWCWEAHISNAVSQQAEIYVGNA